MRLSGSKYNGKFRRFGNTLDVIDEVEFSLEHLLVKKKQCAESLVLSRCGDALFDREMSEKLGDFFFAHFVRMAFAVEKNEAANPIDVGLLGADGVMFHAQMPSDAIK